MCSDQSASLEFKGYSEMINVIKKFKIALGEENGFILEEEKKSTKT